ncbi:hypothetical protein MNV84_01269, partial [Leishmania braziliensis]
VATFSPGGGCPTRLRGASCRATLCTCASFIFGFFFFTSAHQNALLFQSCPIKKKKNTAGAVYTDTVFLLYIFPPPSLPLPLPSTIPFQQPFTMHPPREVDGDQPQRRYGKKSDEDDQRGKKGGGNNMGTAIALAFGAGALVFAGASALYSWCTQDNTQQEKSYYCLHPRDENIAGDTGVAATSRTSFPVASSAADGEEKMPAEATPHSGDVRSDECDVSVSGGADGGHACVCCLERHQSFMFVQCRHICLCEPCLIKLGRAYEDHTLRDRFNGPVRMPCPVCRQVGYIVKTFAS